jgi:methylated-DNA-[protein]-cysteine S-methyltransferase
MLRLLEDKIATPLGPLWVIADEQFNLRAVEWEEHSDRMEELLEIHYRAQGYERISATNPGGLSDKLAAYFEGDLSIIDTLCLPPRRHPFQREVWQALRHSLRAGDALRPARGAARSRRRRTCGGAANGSNPSVSSCPAIASLDATAP